MGGGCGGNVVVVVNQTEQEQAPPNAESGGSADKEPEHPQCLESKPWALSTDFETRILAGASSLNLQLAF